MSNSHNVEVLVIGGGIIGLAIGYFLAQRGLCDVEIIEREFELSSHASGHNAGGISSAHLTQIPEMCELATETSALYRKLAESKNFDFDYQVNGTIVTLSRNERDPISEKEVEEFRERGLSKIELLSPSEVKEREPKLSVEKIGGAIYYPDDAQGNSKKLAQCFAKECLNSGLRVVTGVEALGFVTNNDKIAAVRTNRETLFPKSVVIAAGPWSGKICSLLGLDVPVEPIKGHLITTRKSNSRILRSFITGENYYVLQTCEGNLVVGGGEDSDGFGQSVIDSRVKEAWEEGLSMVPLLSSLGQESVSACLRPHARGGLPIIGRSSEFENLIYATGHFRNGFSLAPVTGKIVSQIIIDGKTKMKIDPFSPKRFQA